MGANQGPECQAQDGTMAESPELLTSTGSLLDKARRPGRASSKCQDPYIVSPARGRTVQPPKAFLTDNIVNNGR